MCTAVRPQAHLVWVHAPTICAQPHTHFRGSWHQVMHAALRSQEATPPASMTWWARPRRPRTAKIGETYNPDTRGEANIESGAIVTKPRVIYGTIEKSTGYFLGETDTNTKTCETKGMICETDNELCAVKHFGASEHQGAEHGAAEHFRRRPILKLYILAIACVCLIAGMLIGRINEHWPANHEPAGHRLNEDVCGIDKLYARTRGFNGNVSGKNDGSGQAVGGLGWDLGGTVGGIGHELGSAVGGMEGPGTGPGSNGSGSGSGTASAGSGFKGLNILDYNGNDRPSTQAPIQAVWQAARTGPDSTVGLRSHGTGMGSSSRGYKDFKGFSGFNGSDFGLGSGKGNLNHRHGYIEVAAPSPSVGAQQVSKDSGSASGSGTYSAGSNIFGHNGNDRPPTQAPIQVACRTAGCGILTT